MTSEPTAAPGGSAPGRVELAEWTQRLATPTRRQVRRRSTVGVVVGAVLVLLGLVGGIVRVVDRGFSVEILGAVLLVVVGGLLCWTGIRRLRWVPAHDPETPVQFSAPYAFELTDDTVIFPAHQGKSAESWPLADTTAVVTGTGRREAVRLSHPGRRPRRFFAHALAQSPAAVVSAVEALRRG